MTMRTAVVFDVDGVLINSPHQRAWTETLAELVRGDWRDIAASTRYRPELFDAGAYQQFAAGIPRLNGAQSILEHFGFPNAEARSARYAREKQCRLIELIDAGAFQPFPDALRFISELHRRNVRLAAASSSKNANSMMEQIHVRATPASAQPVSKLFDGPPLADFFAANVCGHYVAKGKPAPDLFLLAAAALAIDPSGCIVVEDAPAGVAAAKNGGMKAIGIARLHDEAMLSASGADLVVTSLDDVAIDPLISGKLEIRRS